MKDKKSWFIRLLAALCFLLLLSQNGFAQPRVEAFRFPVDVAGKDWRVDVYIKTDTDWLELKGITETSGALEARISISDGQGNKIAEEGLQMASVLNSASFQLEPGIYKLHVELNNGSVDPVFAISKDLIIENPQVDILLSDLVPVEFPKLEEPPFSELFWVEENLSAFNFLLYYEIHTAVSDTMIHLRSFIENEMGEIIKEDSFTISTYSKKRHDYLFVNLDKLMKNTTYLIRLEVEGAEPIVQSEYKFSTRNPELNYAESKPGSFSLQLN